MSATSMAIKQIRWHNKAFWRNPAAAFFVFLFPLMFLVLLTTLLGPLLHTIDLGGGQKVSPEIFYTGSILAFSIITASYSNVAISVTSLREEGVLKRVRGTPLPGWSYLLGKILHSCLIMLVLVGIVSLFGVIFYDISAPTVSLPAFIVTLLVGAAAFCAMGLACSTVIPNVDAALPITNATILPLVFISGMFIPTSLTPAWMSVVADVFPVKHFNHALIEGFLPPSTNRAGWVLGDLLIVALWGAAALVFVVYRFRWEPRR